MEAIKPSQQNRTVRLEWQYSFRREITLRLPCLWYVELSWGLWSPSVINPGEVFTELVFPELGKWESCRKFLHRVNERDSFGRKEVVGLAVNKLWSSKRAWIVSSQTVLWGRWCLNNSQVHSFSKFQWSPQAQDYPFEIAYQIQTWVNYSLSSGPNIDAIFI